jgi:hypothetical protein
MKRDFKGEFYLPGKQNKLSGKLIADSSKNKILLHLFTDKYLTGETIIFNKINHFIENHFEIIHCDAIANELSLIDSSLIGFEVISTHMFKITYEVSFIFENVHISNLNDLSIINAKLHFSYLKTFFNACEVINKDNPKEEYLHVSDPLIITENLIFKLEDKVQQKQPNFDGGYNLHYSKSIMFEYKVGVCLETLLKDVYNFSSLLTFTTNKPINFVFRFITIESSSVEKTNHYFKLKNEQSLCYLTHFPRNNSKNEIKNDLHQNHMLFSKWHFSDLELHKFIAKWFNNKQFKPIYDFFIDSNNWFSGNNIVLSNVMFNNKFLNVIQGLESYFDLLDVDFISDNDTFTKNRQKILNKIDNDDLRTWLRKNLKFPRSHKLVDKLTFFANRYDYIFKRIDNIESFVVEYPIDAAEYRNKLSHGKIEQTFQGENFDKIYSFSKILLCFCILESIGFESKDIERIFRSNIFINDEIRNVQYS